MQISDALRLMSMAFTRERAAIDSARCMVIGTTMNDSLSDTRPTLENLRAETQRMMDAEESIRRFIENRLRENA